MASILSRDELLAKTKPNIKLEMLPEFGPDVGIYIRQLNGKEREEFGRSIPESTCQSEVNRIACAFCLCDANGVPLFTPADIDLLAQQQPDAYNRLGPLCIAFNAINRAGIDDAKKD